VTNSKHPSDLPRRRRDTFLGHTGQRYGSRLFISRSRRAWAAREGRPVRSPIEKRTLEPVGAQFDVVCLGSWPGRSRCPPRLHQGSEVKRDWQLAGDNQSISRLALAKSRGLPRDLVCVCSTCACMHLCISEYYKTVEKRGHCMRSLEPIERVFVEVHFSVASSN